VTSTPGQSTGSTPEQPVTGGRDGDVPPTGEADVHAEVAAEVAAETASKVAEEVAADVAEKVTKSRLDERGDEWADEVSSEVAADRAAEAEAMASGEVHPGVAHGTVHSDTEALLPVAELLAAERLADLQRLQAEYVNYRRRVERDRSVARETAVASVLEGLLGVLDDIELARQHGDLEGGPFAAIAEKLEAALGRFGLSRFGTAGEPFDPTVHDALMHQHSDDVEVTTVTQVLQPGYKVDDKVLRAARVAVSDPH
jgi:molecular chaperone GrpE